jgi:hypothetical protein
LKRDSLLDQLAQIPRFELNNQFLQLSATR